MSQIDELIELNQALREKIIQLRNENERLKRELEAAYEKINLLDLKNSVQLLSPIEDTSKSYRIIPHNEDASTPSQYHENKKGGKKTSI